MLTGQTVGNLVDGKVYRRVGPALSGSPDLTPGLGQDYSNGSLWRPVAADYLAGESPATVAAGKTVAVWDAALVQLPGVRAAGQRRSARAVRCRRWRLTTRARVGSSCRVFFNGDGTLNMGELGADAVGFFIEDAALGLVLGERADTAEQPGQQRAATKNSRRLKASAASAGLVGLDDDIVTLTVRGITVEVNTGSPAAPGAAVPPAIDWAGSFPLSAEPGDQVGYEVETGDPAHPVVFGAEGYLIGGGVELFVLGIGEFVHLRGAAYFEMGRVATVPLRRRRRPERALGAAGRRPVPRSPG